MPSSHGPSCTIVGAIRRLNSQKHGFATQNRVRAKHTPIWGVLCAHTGLGGKFEIMVVQPPYFAGRLVFYYAIGEYIARWCERTKKIDAKPIFRPLEQCHNLALILETPEIGEASICSGLNTDAWYISLLHNIILDWPQKTVNKFQKSRSK